MKARALASPAHGEGTAAVYETLTDLFRTKASSGNIITPSLRPACVGGSVEKFPDGLSRVMITTIPLLDRLVERGRF